MATRERKRRRKKDQENGGDTFVGEGIAQVQMEWKKDTTYKSVFHHPQGRTLGLPYDNQYIDQDFVGEAETVWVAISTRGPIITRDDLTE